MPSSQDLTDRDLVTIIVTRGDEGAFRTLYRRHTPALFRIASRLTLDREDVAEEIVHDTWLRAASRWAEFEWRSSLKTWLTGILLNRVREVRRAWTRERTDPLSEEPEDPADFALDTRLDLESAINRLPPGYRAAVVLHDIEGYAHQEIAMLLGIDVGTSKSQLARARRSLRRWLEPGFGVTA